MDKFTIYGIDKVNVYYYIITIKTINNKLQEKNTMKNIIKKFQNFMLKVYAFAMDAAVIAMFVLIVGLVCSFFATSGSVLASTAVVSGMVNYLFCAFLVYIIAKHSHIDLKNRMDKVEVDEYLAKWRK